MEAGGVQLQGGLTILSGGISMPEQPFHVGELTAVSKETNLLDPLISGFATSPHYAGSILELTASVSDPATTTEGLLDSADRLSF